MQAFSILSEIRYNKPKKTYCTISKQAIDEGDKVYAYKHKNHEDCPFEYALTANADKDIAFAENKNNFLNRTYPIEAFISENIFISIPKNLLPFHTQFEKGLDFLQNPLQHALPSNYFYSYLATQAPTITEAYDYVKRYLPPNISNDKLLDTTLMQMLEDEKAPEIFSGMVGHFSNRLQIKEASLKNIDATMKPQSALQLLGYWLYTPYHQWFISHWHSLSNELKIVLSFSDISFFAEQVELQMQIPHWRMLLTHLFSQKFTFENFNYVSQWAIENKKHIPLLAKAIYTYDLQHFTHLPDRDFSHYSYKDNATRLVYLFIAMPEYEPVLHKFIHEGIYPGDHSGERFVMQCHYYRTAILYLALNNENHKAENLMERMLLELKRHFNGSPKTFINDTLRWAKMLMKSTKS